MVLKDKIKEGIEELKRDHGAFEDLSENKEAITEQFGSVDNLIDTYEEINRVYIQYLRTGKLEETK